LPRFQDAAGQPVQQPYFCSNCKEIVDIPDSGTGQRNHCPHCLWSLHVDRRNGDRGSACRSPMEPIAVWVKPTGEWAVVHRCTGCGALRANRIAGDDNEVLLLSLALKPLARPAFSLEKLRLKS
jgi:hypothetical protein